MRIPRLIRRQLTAVLAASLLMLAAACSSGPQKTPNPLATTRLGDINFLAETSVVECALHRGLIPASALGPGSRLSQWYSHGRVINNRPFVLWWLMNQGAFAIKGKNLAGWRDLTSQRGKLPVELCGSTAIPSPRPSA
jgi:hypothetical protein